MPNLGNETKVVASLLDRLIDDDPTAVCEELPVRLQNHQQLKASVARDLEALLNTRQELFNQNAADFPEVDRSIVTYGLPDFSAFNLRSQRDRQAVHRAVENAISKFEPRLADVRVSLEPLKEHDRNVRFRVDALLKMDPALTPVSFDTVLRLNTQEYVVKGQN